MFTIGTSVVVSHPVNNAHSVFRHLFFFFSPMAPVHSYHLFSLDLLELWYWKVSVKRIKLVSHRGFLQYVLQVWKTWLTDSLLALGTIHKRRYPILLWYGILWHGIQWHSARLQRKVPFTIKHEQSLSDYFHFLPLPAISKTYKMAHNMSISGRFDQFLFNNSTANKIVLTLWNIAFLAAASQ